MKSLKNYPLLLILFLGISNWLSGQVTSGCEGVFLATEVESGMSLSEPFMICPGRNIQLNWGLTNPSTSDCELTSEDVMSFVYEWKINDVIVEDVTGSALSTPLFNPGVVTIEITAFLDNEAVVTESTMVTVIDGPSASISTEPLVCEGEDVILISTSTGNNLSYVWLQNGNVIPNANQESTSLSGLAPGMYDFVLQITDINTGCTSAASQEVTIVEANEIDLQLSSSFVCQAPASDVTLTVTNAGQFTNFVWENLTDGTTFSNTTSSLTFSPTETTQVRVTADGGEDCTSTETATIQFIDPDLTVMPTSLEVCDGEIISISANSNAEGVSYSWTILGSEPPIGNDPTLDYDSDNLDTTGTFTILCTVTTPEGCVNVRSVAVQVSPSPIAVASASIQTICQGEEVGLIRSEIDDVSTYSWREGSEDGPEVPGGLEPTVTPTATTTYFLVGELGDCRTVDNVTITVVPTPTVEIVNAESPVCSEEQVIIALSGTPGATFIVSGTEADTITISPEGTATFMNESELVSNTEFIFEINSISIFASGIECTANPAISDSLAIVNQPVASIDVLNDVSCIGNNATFVITGTPNAIVTYSNGVEQFDVIIGPNDTVLVDSIPVATGEITLTLVQAATPGSDLCVNDNLDGSSTITILPSPEVNVGVSADEVCQGQDVTLFVSGGSDQLIYTWFDAQDNELGTGNNVVTEVTGNSSPFYLIALDTVNFCTVQSDPIPIGILPSPTAEAGIAATVCAGGEVSLGGAPTASGGTPDYTYNWGSGVDPVANPTVIPLVTTTYTLIVADANSCEATDTVEITVENDPLVTFLEVGNTVEVCLEDVLELTVNVAGGFGQNSQFNWQSRPLGTTDWNNIDGVNSEVLTEVITAEMEYRVRVIQEGVDCISEFTDPVAVVIVPAPETQIDATFSQVCSGQQTIYSVLNPASEDSQFDWSVTGPVEVTEIEAIGPVLLVQWPSAPGNYTVSVIETIGTGTCVESADLNVVVNNQTPSREPAEIIFSSLNNILIYNDSLTACHQWGYYDPATNELITLEGETYQSYVAGTAYDPDRIYWVQAWGSRASGEPTADCNNPVCAHTVFFRADGTPTPPEEPEAVKTVLYPNPNKGLFQVEINQLPKERYEARIVDLFGRIIVEQQVITSNGAINLSFEMADHLANGLYHFALMDEDKGRFITIPFLYAK